jgi:hypothetical protein
MKAEEACHSQVHSRHETTGTTTSPLFQFVNVVVSTTAI